jgi:formylglycine-generating enzyme required for sulfatase activity
MGGRPGEEKTDVIISRGFWMGKYEVTQVEYLQVMGNNPSWFNGLRDTGTELDGDYGVNLNRPVENVWWGDATAYCNALTKQERTAGRIPANCVYRLPTSAEWEYACRAWTSTRFSYGDDPTLTDLTNFAWYGDNSSGQTHPVGQKLPNSWGLYDMHGNVREWCGDWGGSLHGGILLDPQGPSSGMGRVYRGGNFGDEATACMSFSRESREPMGGSVAIRGFRVVLAPVQP